MNNKLCIILIFGLISAFSFDAYAFGFSNIYSPDSVSVAASLVAQNTFSSSVNVWGKFIFRLRGTWVGTVHLQRSDDNGLTWDDVDSFISNAVVIGEEPERKILYRFGVKTGNYTSGTVSGRISQ